MAANSKIEWTDHTFNPWIGCSKVHEGCTHCYAESLARRTGRAKWGPNGTRSKTSEKYWREPLKWDREAAESGVRKRVFCASLADVFEEWSGPVLSHTGHELGIGVDGRLCFEGERRATLDDIRRDLFRLIDQTPHLDWLLLTKRPENVWGMWPGTVGDALGEIGAGTLYRPNVHLGTSISNQPTTNRMVPELLKSRGLCPVLFLSAEPLLGKLTFRWALWHDFGGVTWHLDGIKQINQVIVGIESAGKRVGRLGDFASESDWCDAAESIVRQCAEAGVAAFVKQCPVNGQVSHEPEAWRESLRVRQFPEPIHHA